MKPCKIHEIRNVGLVGHGASGKTSVAEAALYLSGVSDRLGKVGDNSSMMDYDPDEVKRGHSIGVSAAFLEWNKNKINLVDAPGSANFIADAVACLRVVDSAVVVVSAADGVQFYTEKFWKWADEQSLQRVVFVNKLDHERANIDPVLDSIRRKFKKKTALLHVPVGEGEAFSGIFDLVTNAYFVYQRGGKGVGQAGQPPKDLADELETRRAELVEAVAETDDELLEKYLENGELSQEDFNSGLRNGIQKGDLVPVLCGSALFNMGIDLLLNAMNEFLPPPNRRPALKAKSARDDSEIVVAADENAAVSGLVFKTIADPYAGKLTLFRVFSGSIKADSNVYNVNKQTSERVGQIFALQGKKQTPVPEVSAGDIGAVAKLKVTATGDTLGSPDSPLLFQPIRFPLPVLSRALVPKTRADEEKISAALHRLVEEDPTLKVDRDAKTHELLITGMGQAHLDVIIERMKRRFGVEVDVKPPKVPYLETIRGAAKVQGKYKKQTGGRGQYGDAWLEISPLPRGDGFQFENRIVGGAIPRQYVPAVEKGVHEAMSEGFLAHYPLVDIKVALYDGSYHDVDSSEMAFKIAGSLGFKKGVAECKPILLEPIMHMEVSIPGDYVGDIIGDLNSKRGKILGIDANEDSQTIKAHIPMASIMSYAADLTALTGGRGSFAAEFSHYDDLPEHIAAKVIEEAGKERK
ncbi:MAG: elongation factor G [Nitrospinae bacterium]|nr:elongation factor G [Nitrospinota bacterium]